MKTLHFRYLYGAVGVILILPLLLIAPEYLESHDNILIVKILEDNSIAKYDTSKNEVQEIYRSDKYRTLNISVAPSNKYIAFIEETEPLYQKDEYPVAPNNCLTIIDGTGKLVHRIEKNVKRYVWSPVGDKIAFLSFNPCDPDYEYMCPSGAWIFDLETAEMTQIADRATEINWAIYDSSIYLYFSGQVMKWNSQSSKLENREYNDIYFSPDGKFYLCLWKDEGKPIQLYETLTNSKVLDIKIYKQLLPLGDTAKAVPVDIGDLWSSHDLDPPYGWVFNSGHYLLFTKSDVNTETEGDGSIKRIKSLTVRNASNFIYDPLNKSVIRRFEGLIGQWVGDGSRIILETGNKVVFQDIP